MGTRQIRLHRCCGKDTEHTGVSVKRNQLTHSIPAKGTTLFYKTVCAGAVLPELVESSQMQFYFLFHKQYAWVGWKEPTECATIRAGGQGGDVCLTHWYCA